MSKYVIEDGYTEDGYIAERPGIHGAVTFKYRPMTHRQRLAIQAKLNQMSAEDSSGSACTAVAKFVVEWNIPSSDGGTLPITPNTVAMLKPSLIERLYSIIYGVDGGDTNPDALPDGDKLKAEFDALLEGKPVSVAREEGDSKN